MTRMRKALTMPLIAVAAVGLLVGACSSDSPTAPQQQQTQISNPVPQAAWTVTVSASPGEIETDPTTLTLESFVSVTARNQSNGQLPPDGAAIVLTTTSGGFVVLQNGAEATQRSVVINTTRGQASAILQVDGTTAGTVVVQAQLEQSFGQAVVSLVEPEPEPVPPPPDPFFLAAVTPSFGPPEGSAVQITGSGFSEPVRVLFGGTPGVVRSVSSSSIIVETPRIDLPPGQTTTVGLSVTVNLNDTNPEEVQATDNLPNAFTYARSGGGGLEIPRIFSLSPRSGPNEGGTEVVINGEGFSDQVQVFFSDQALVEVPVQSVSSNRLVVRTPAATGSNFINLNAIVTVRVVNADTGFETTLGQAFQYGDGQGGAGVQITTAGPTTGPYFGGQIVTIQGSGFEEPVAVGFGGFAQSPVSVTGTEVVARSAKVRLTGCQSVSGPFSITNIETGELASSNIDYTYEPILVSLGSFTPESTDTDVLGNLLAPGTVITFSNVVGFHGTDVPTITFGDGFAFGASFTPDPGDPARGMITAQIPPFAGMFDEEECTTAGGETGMGPVATRVDVTITNNQTECDLVLTNRFTYVPPADSCEVDQTQITPIVISLSATSSPDTGGGPITISGQSFVDPVRVTFGGANATVGGTSSTSVSATIPPFLGPFDTEACNDNMDMITGSRNLPTLVDVTVTNLVSGNSDTLSGSFTYTPTDISCQGD